ncbi:MAG: YtxH domain-containing protein [Pyrinomonadaceae bacterium]
MTVYRPNEENRTSDISSSTSTGIFYLLAGAGIGAALALLFAPKSGTELRTDIADLTRKGYDEGLNLASRAKDQSAGLLQSVKEGSGKVYDLAANRLGRGQARAGDEGGTGNGRDETLNLLSDDDTDDTGGSREKAFGGA